MDVQKDQIMKNRKTKFNFPVDAFVSRYYINVKQWLENNLTVIENGSFRWTHIYQNYLQ